MNNIYQAIAILWITTALGGLASTASGTIKPSLSIGELSLSKQSDTIPKTAEDFFNRGLDKYDREDYLGAIEDYNRVLQLDPKFIEAYCNRGLTKATLGDMKGAIEDFDLALQINSAHADAYNKRGNAHASLSEFSTAIEDFNQALQSDPQFFDAYYNLSLIHI